MTNLGITLLVVVSFGYAAVNVILIFKDGRPVEAAILLLLTIALGGVIVKTHIDGLLEPKKVRYTVRPLVLLQPLNAGYKHA